MILDKKILIADDDPAIMDSLIDLLSKKYQITKAYDGQEALDIINSGNNFNLLILDIMMPNLSGFELAMELTKAGNQTPFIFLTAKSSLDDIISGFNIGAEDYIVKPFSNKELLERIKRKLLIEEKIANRNNRLSLFNHNILNPLNSVCGYVDLLVQNNKINQKTFKNSKIENSLLVAEEDLEDFFSKNLSYLSEIQKSLANLIKTSRNLSEVFTADKQKIQASCVNLKTFIYDAIKISKPKKLALTIEKEIPEISISIDYDKLIKVFFEIFDNALLHNNNKEKAVNLKVIVIDDKIEFEFLDNGNGIPNEFSEKVFEEFWTGLSYEHFTRGEGLGLWIAKKFIEAHEGKIWIDQSIENGACIKFQIPTKQIERNES